MKNLIILFSLMATMASAQLADSTFAEIELLSLADYERLRPNPFQNQQLDGNKIFINGHHLESEQMYLRDNCTSSRSYAFSKPDQLSPEDSLLNVYADWLAYHECSTEYEVMRIYVKDEVYQDIHGRYRHTADTARYWDTHPYSNWDLQWMLNRGYKLSHLEYSKKHIVPIPTYQGFKDWLKAIKP